MRAKHHYEVSAYGSQTNPHFIGDTNDNWKILTMDGKDLNVLSKFKLYHIYQQCYLFSFQNRLPQWGFGKREVSCMNATYANADLITYILVIKAGSFQRFLTNKVIILLI